MQKKLLSLLVLILPSCTALIDHQGERSTTRLALMLGSDAASVSMPGGWNVTGLNNSSSVKNVANGVVTKAALGVGGEVIKPLSKSAGEAIETLAR